MGFFEDIKQLIANIDRNLLSDWKLSGIQYDYYPWHGYSAISLRSRDDKIQDNAADWKLFEISKSDGTLIREEIEAYNSGDGGQWTYHRQLCQAAKDLMAFDFTTYVGKPLVEGWTLYGPLKLLVFDPDNTYSFNYCEYVLAKEHDAHAERGKMGKV